MPIGQIAPGCHQLVVAALNEVLPEKLGVARLRGSGGQVIAQRVGVILAQVIGHINGSPPALAELSTTEVEVFSDTGCKNPSV
jgi:hypothetical protein